MVASTVKNGKDRLRKGIRPHRSLKWRATYRIDVHTILDGFSCHPVKCEHGPIVLVPVHWCVLHF